MKIRITFADAQNICVTAQSDQHLCFFHITSKMSIVSISEF